MVTERQPVKKNTRATKAGDDVGGETVESDPSKPSTARGRKKVVAGVSGKGKGKGKAVEDEVEKTDVADEGTDEEAIGLTKGRKKKVTFSLGSGKSKGKGKAVEEQNEADEDEDDIETDVEEGEDVEIDVVDAAVKMAVNVGKNALKKKAVAKLTEVTKDRPLEPKALKMVQRKTEVGEG
ncbi:uncharacterized protein LOC141656064 [Silene latifolia]|uniref:uncharacterized protein LOC141656064 n=1 Tax=Silene latifolia TaxID=37657 RepID=UPI003D7864AB